MTERLLTIKEVRELQMQIMDDIHNYCSAHNLHYTLTSGTMIGAMRHKGYIPWDDDIDIMMPRPDYEYFMDNYKPGKEYLAAVDHRVDKNYISSFAKVYDTRTFTKSGNIIDNRSVSSTYFQLTDYLQTK
nr:LicD family protein [Bacteroides sp.]